MIKYQKKVLDNGLIAITAPMENTEAATLMVLTGVGSRYEEKSKNGISHFLEHMFFKGTTKRPKSGQVHRDLDKIGADHNAFTSKETTGFWVKCAGKDFDEGIDIVSDILFAPLFKNEEIERERGVIFQEISMYEDEPRRRVWDIFESELFGDRPIGWEIAGTKETVSGITRKDIIEFKQKHYFAENMLVVVAGKIDNEAVYRKINKTFGRIKSGKSGKIKKISVKEKIPLQKGGVKIISKDSDQTHLAVGARGYDIFDERKYAMELLTVILGGNFSSRLVMEIREKLGLAYYVFSHAGEYTDCGYVGIGAGVAHENLEKTLKKISDILANLVNKPVSAGDLDDAKSYIRGQMALKIEGSDDIAEFCAGQQFFYKKIKQPEEIFKKIEKVSKNDILKVAKDIFSPANLRAVAIGRQDNKKEVYYKNVLCRQNK